jgi:catechol 2,3-dioxygenase-like lactoylglutathione lyase family enzyme
MAVNDDRDLDAMFRALADSTRRVILDELAKRDDQPLFEICVRLVEGHGMNLTRQAISKHLAVLENADLVDEAAYQQTFGTLALAHRVVEQARAERRSRMRIVVTSVFVEDQEKALSFYTEVLGFQKKKDVPVGEFRWLTVVSPEEPDGVELLLEPSGHPAVKPFKQALVEDGIPFTSFGVEDVKAEHARLEGLGVKFTQPPTTFGDVTTAVFDDTCGNLIQIAQQ